MDFCGEERQQISSMKADSEKTAVMREKENYYVNMKRSLQK